MERRGDKRNQNSKEKDIKTLWFVDDEFNVADSGDALQISVHKLHGIKNCNKEHSTTTLKKRSSEK